MTPVVAAIGTQELLIVAIIILLLFGAAKIPDLARSLGRAKAEYRKGAAEGGPASEDEKVREAARALGIPVEGRSVPELRAEIARRVSK